MRRPRTSLIIGVLLLLLSLPLLWQQAREAYLGARVYERYKPDALEGSSTVLNGRAVTIGPAEVHVAGRSFRRSPNSDVALLNVFDADANETSAMVVERFGGREKQSWRYRIFKLDTAGAITVDEFTFDERGERPYRVVAARFVSPEPIGFENESLQQWPGLLYPVLYPWVTTVVGVVALIVAARQHQPARAS